MNNPNQQAMALFYTVQKAPSPKAGKAPGQCYSLSLVVGVLRVSVEQESVDTSAD